MSILSIYFLGVLLTYIALVYRGSQGFSKNLTLAVQWPYFAVKLFPSFFQYVKTSVFNGYSNLRAMGTIGTIIIIFIILTILTKGAFLKFILGVIGFFVLLAIIVFAVIIYRIRKGSRRF